MDTVLEYLTHIGENVALTVTLFAALATVFSNLIKQFFTLRALPHARKSTTPTPAKGKSEPPSGTGGKGWRTQDAAPSSQVIARAHSVQRLDEVKAARAKEDTSAKVSRVLAGALTFAQVVIGGVLASSFVQESLSPKAVGIFGVLVLIASLVKQQYRPEVDAEHARQNASRLEALIRFAEDELAKLDARSANGEDRTDAFIDLTQKVSLLLTEIENPDALPAAKGRQFEDAAASTSSPAGTTDITASK